MRVFMSSWFKNVSKLPLTCVLRPGRRATLLWRMPKPQWSFTKWWRWSGRRSWPPDHRPVSAGCGRPHGNKLKRSCLWRPGVRISPLILSCGQKETCACCTCSTSTTISFNIQNFTTVSQRFGFSFRVLLLDSLRVCVMVKVLLPPGGSHDLIPATTESPFKSAAMMLNTKLFL